MSALKRNIKTRLIRDAREETKPILRPDITPDMWRLGQYKWWHVFVPDDFMSGREHNWMLKNYTDVEKKPVHPVCYTKQPFTFWKKDLGGESFPIILPGSYRPTGFVKWEVIPARIQGELWKVHPEAFILLDNHKQNGIQFRRVRADIILPCSEVYYSKKRPLPEVSDEYIRAEAPAFMYVGIRDYWDPLIGGIFAGAQLTTIETNKKYLKEYYKFE